MPQPLDHFAAPYLRKDNDEFVSHCRCAKLSWDYSLPTLIVMSLCALLIIGEVVIRGLRRYYAVAASAVGISFGYYFFLLSVVASAAV